MTISFDTTSLDHPAIVSMDVSATSKKWTFRCAAATTTNALLLQAKTATVNKRILLDGTVSLQGDGTKGSLVIVTGETTDTYTNCMITAPISVKPVDRAETYYEYYVTVEQDTAG